MCLDTVALSFTLSSALKSALECTRNNLTATNSLGLFPPCLFLFDLPAASGCFGVLWSERSIYNRGKPPAGGAVGAEGQMGMTSEAHYLAADVNINTEMGILSSKTEQRPLARALTVQDNSFID